MIATLAALPWQEIAVMTLFGAAIFGVAVHLVASSRGGCGNCSCSAGKNDGPECRNTDKKKQP